MERAFYGDVGEKSLQRERRVRRGGPRNELQFIQRQAPILLHAQLLHSVMILLWFICNTVFLYEKNRAAVASMERLQLPPPPPLTPLPLDRRYFFIKPLYLFRLCICLLLDPTSFGVRSTLLPFSMYSGPLCTCSHECIFLQDELYIFLYITQPVNVRVRFTWRNLLLLLLFCYVHVFMFHKVDQNKRETFFAYKQKLLRLGDQVGCGKVNRIEFYSIKYCFKNKFKLNLPTETVHGYKHTHTKYINKHKNDHHRIH